MEAGYASAEFHPDGLILGTGTQDALVRIWETRQQKVPPPLLCALPIDDSHGFIRGNYAPKTKPSRPPVLGIVEMLLFRSLGECASAVPRPAFPHCTPSRGLLLAPA